MKKKFIFLAVLSFLIFFSSWNLSALSFTDISSATTTLFYNFTNENEGTSSYRSLLIPTGGRPESLGNAFTGLSDDSSYINYNAAGGCIQKQTQLSAIHNSWIADSSIDTISYTTRFGHLGIGGLITCFYVPFSEYNISGERTNSSYYTETMAALNVSYNFIAGYDFKGFALGTSVKTCWRGVPNFADNDTNAIISGSGFSQSGMAIMADLGLMLQFNFLKYFASRDPNVKIGVAVQNLGVGFTGIGGNSGIHFDDPLPTYIAAGMSVKFLPWVMVTADIKQPINLFDITNYQIFSLGVGASFEFTDYFTLLAGLELRGGNPRLSAGGEFEIRTTRINFNYSLDLTTSVSPINRISVSAKIMLGDKGRAEIQKEIDVLYNEGLVYYYSSEWEKAIEVWNKILLIDKRYDPAILGIESAKSQIEMFQKVRDSMFFEE
ncbi:MAG: UPF0164 family protein [Treponema sp.]|nr:UPF0164 family protein [Treponema sp.]